MTRVSRLDYLAPFCYTFSVRREKNVIRIFIANINVNEASAFCIEGMQKREGACVNIYPV